MIVGLGTDIIAISRIAKTFDEFSQKFIDRILNADEQLKYQQANDPMRYLAKQYAIKEAASKALGTGFREGIGWHDISVRHNDLGAPSLHFVAEAEVQFNKIGAKQSWLTLSDEKEYVVATVILEK